MKTDAFDKGLGKTIRIVVSVIGVIGFILAYCSALLGPIVAYMALYITIKTEHTSCWLVS